LAVQSRSKRAADAAMATGWWSARFQREERLKPLADYLAAKPERSPASAMALADWARRNDARFNKKRSKS
jgi:hypothetical protein